MKKTCILIILFYVIISLGTVIAYYGNSLNQKTVNITASSQIIFWTFPIAVINQETQEAEKNMLWEFFWRILPAVGIIYLALNVRKTRPQQDQITFYANIALTIFLVTLSFLLLSLAIKPHINSALFQLLHLMLSLICGFYAVVTSLITISFLFDEHRKGSTILIITSIVNVLMCTLTGVISTRQPNLLFSYFVFIGIITIVTFGINFLFANIGTNAPKPLRIQSF